MPPATCYRTQDGEGASDGLSLLAHALGGVVCQLGARLETFHLGGTAQLLGGCSSGHASSEWISQGSTHCSFRLGMEPVVRVLVHTQPLHLHLLSPFFCFAAQEVSSLPLPTPPEVPGRPSPTLALLLVDRCEQAKGEAAENHLACMQFNFLTQGGCLWPLRPLHPMLSQNCKHLALC